MLSLMGVILVVAQMSGAQALNINDSGMMDEMLVTAPRYEGEDIAYSGMMPEMVVTAPRYYSEAEMGMMPEVTVTAPRYEGEDIAYSGMMPEVVVTAPRYEGEDIAYSGMMPEMVVTAPRSNTVFEYTTIGEKRDENGWNCQLLTTENIDCQKTIYYN